MSAQPFAFDPALEELLHELARDPRSSLLRVKRPARPARWTDSWDALSRWSPSLTNAEQEILDVHRAEFATLLLQRWADEIELRPPPKLFLVKASTAKHPAPPADLEALRADSERLRGEPGLSPPAPELSALLETTQPLTSEQMSALVTTAVQVHPTSRARIHHALDLVRTNQPRTAVGVLRRLLDLESKQELRSSCWENMALAYGHDGNPSALAACYGNACEMEDPRLSALAGWLLLSVQSGALAMAQQAAEMLDALFDAADPRIEQHAQRQMSARLQGLWAPRAIAKVLLDDLMEDVGPTSRRVLDVLA